MKPQICQRITGASMVEVLITIVIVALGLLGVAGLEASALKYLKTAAQRSEASQIAYDIGERMRANKVAVLSGNYRLDRAYSASAGTFPDLPTACNAANCSSADVAVRDLAEMQRHIAAKLNGGAAYIVPGAVGWDISILWKEAGFTGNDSSCPSAASPVAGVRCFNLRTTL